MSKFKPSSAAEFRKHKEAKLETPEQLTLPSGLKILARRPSPTWLLLQAKVVPTSLAAKLSTGGGIVDAQDAKDFSTLFNLTIDTIMRVIVEPKISLTPGPNEIHPDDISDEDLKWLIGWSVGEKVGTAPSADDLDTFRGESSGPTPDARVSSGRMAAETL